jgi:hypothetical protein
MNTAVTTARDVEASRPVQWLGRLGDVCYGVVYIVVAWLALQIAFGGTTAEADQRGAVTTIAAQPLGGVLLWVMAIGLVAFGLWQLLFSVTGYRWVSDERKRTTRRLSTAGRAVIVLAIASFTFQLLVGGGSGGGGNSGQQEMTARLLQLPGGRVVVFVIGLCVVAAGCFAARRGLGKRFMRDLDTGRMSARARRVVEPLGMLGWLAKAVAWAVIGILLCTAAVHVDPNRAGGLDKALRTLAQQPFGVVLLVAVAIGFIAFGLYWFADSRYRRR